MGGGRGGLHKGTYGSREGEELRARVGDALKQFGSNAAADAAAGLADALVRIASGESPEDIVPEPGEIAFDLALDALSSFVPGGGRFTRELGGVARARKRSSGAGKSAGRLKVLIDDDRGRLTARPGIRMGRTETAIVMGNLNTYYHARLQGRGQCKFPIGSYEYELVTHGFANYEIIGRREIN